MTFTDDNLEWLKGNCLTSNDVLLNQRVIASLISRLEAAEAYCLSQRSTSADNQLKREAWRKAAGR